mmetsp:Transcript_17626/g.24480  ORF Transcript_17626/g.24480 Transcript_17626/m.24480 type:complete len:430 (+) Transcript_17626:157-1446(+)
MMPTLQVSLLTSQNDSTPNNEEPSQKLPSLPSVTSNSSPTYSSVRSMKDLLNPPTNNTDYNNNDLHTLKENPQSIHDKAQLSNNRLIDSKVQHISSPKDNLITPGITLPSLAIDIHKPPSSNSETSLRLPSIEQNNLDPSTVHTDIHNAGSMNVSQLINVSSPQYYQFMLQNPTSSSSTVPGPNYPLNPLPMVPPPSGSPPSPTTSSNGSTLPAVKELLPSSQQLMQPGYQVAYNWYPYPPPANYMPPRPGVAPVQAVPFYGQVQEVIPVMVEASVEEDSKKRKAPPSAKKVSSPTMGSQSSNCQHHPKPDSDPKTVPFQLKFKSKKERPKNGAFEMQWMEHFTTLKYFYEQFGHTNVTRSTPGYKNLGNWVAEQRRKMRRGKLTKEQYELMNSIAFEWDRSYFFKPSVFTNSDEEQEGSEEKKFKPDP